MHTDLNSEKATNYKTYIGDGVYAEYDGWHVSVYTSDGIIESPRVHLDPNVLDALIRFRERVRIIS